MFKQQIFNQKDNVYTKKVKYLKYELKVINF